VNVLPDDLFNIGADGGRRVHHLVHEKLVEDGGLARVVQAHNADLVFWKKKEIISLNYIRTSCKVRLYGTKLALWHKGV
jgi:hypothetical protein